MIDDFSDISSWMGGAAEGGTPGAFRLPAYFSLGSVPDARRDDGYAGELRFTFAQPNGYVRFWKNTAHQARLTPLAFEFSANAQGNEGAISFGLTDQANKQYRTRPVPVSGNDWKNHRFEINEETLPGLSDIRFPVLINHIGYQSTTAATGSILIDDIACITDVSKPGQQLTIHPVYEALATTPGTPARMAFRLRNALPKSVDVTLKLTVTAPGQEVVRSIAKTIVIDPNRLEAVSFDLGAFSRKGGYAVILTADNGHGQQQFLGWLGVFQPNGRRVNTAPMWFGTEDQELHTSPHEAALHAKWIKDLGVDIVRAGVEGRMIEPIQGNALGYDGFRKMWKPYEDAGIDILFNYAEYVPSWTRPTSPPEGVVWPDGNNPELFRQHMDTVGKFIASIPQVKYFEWLNEPNLPHYRRSAEEYTAALRELYPILKKHAPHLKVGTGGMAFGHPREHRGLAEKTYQDNSEFYDIALYHAHDALPGYKGRTEHLQRLLSVRNLEKPIANSETGYRSHQNDPALFYDQAGELVKKVTYSRAAGLEFYIWFMVQDYWDKYVNGDDSFGLVTVDNQPKPAFVAYNELIRQLANTTPVHGQSLDSRLESYQFEVANETIFVAWPKQENRTFTFCVKSESPVDIIDIFGNIDRLTPSNGIIYVTSQSQPFYLRSAKGALIPFGDILNASGNTVLAAGTDSSLEISIRNPYNQAVRYNLTGGGLSRDGQLARGAEAKVLLPLKIPAHAGDGSRTISADLTLSDNNRQTLWQGNVKFDYFVALSVAEDPQKSSVIRLANVRQMTELAFDPSTPRWAGRNDLSAEIIPSWSREGLHFRATVRDQDHQADATGSSLFLNDSIQLGFANQKGEHTEITVSDGPEGAAQAWCHVSPEREKIGAIHIPLSVQRKEDQTFYAFTLPWSLIGVSPNKREQFRMAILVNDNDGGKRLRIMEWNRGIGGANGKDPSLFGWVELR